MIFVSVGPAPGALAAPEISRGISEAGHRVEVGLSESTRAFVGPAAFAPFADVVPEPTEPPEALVFVPADAATLARLARGMMEDDGLARATQSCPVFVAPALDAATARHPAVRENLRLLRADGRRVIGGEGDGPAPAGEVVARVLSGLQGPLSGMRILVTAGGTHEPMDSVRFIGNRSSGKMGLALAREALRLGAEVVVVAANISTEEPGTETHAVETVEELREAVLRLAGDADALLMAAAVSDFAPAERVQEKIRRGSGFASLKLEPTADVLAAVRERYPDLFMLGFAATHGDPVPDAREKLRKKGVNLVVGNDISQTGIGFGAAENEVYVVGPDGERFVPRASKEAVARAILGGMVEEMDKERQT